MEATTQARQRTKQVGPANDAARRATVRAIYRRLSRAWGAQHWWPAASPFEVIAGSILTQNTSWKNVERALGNLRRARVLNLAGMRRISLPALQRLARPSGYFRQKARKLKSFVAFVDLHYGGSLPRMFARPTAELRSQLLTIRGIGPETADAILLYAGHHESFVVDAYARRIFERHGILAAQAKYEDIRELVQRSLQKQTPGPAAAALQQTPEAHAPSRMSLAARSPRAQVYNEMHGLLVQVGKHYCLKAEARCASCPLGPMSSSPLHRG